MRLFFAVEIGSPAREAFARCLADLSGCGADVRWSSGSPHLTLAFLGETPQERLPGAARAGERAAGAAAPFSARLRGLSLFDSWARPKVLWVGLAADPLAGLAGALRVALGEEGFGIEDRPFVPHVTLGRFRSPRGAQGLRRRAAAWEPEAAWAGADFAVTELVLLRSSLKPSGAEHEALSRLPLEGRA